MRCNGAVGADGVGAVHLGDATNDESTDGGRPYRNVLQGRVIQSATGDSA